MESLALVHSLHTTFTTIGRSITLLLLLLAGLLLVSCQKEEVGSDEGTTRILRLEDEGKLDITRSEHGWLIFADTTDFISVFNNLSDSSQNTDIFDDTFWGNYQEKLPTGYSSLRAFYRNSESTTKAFNLDVPEAVDLGTRDQVLLTFLDSEYAAVQIGDSVIFSRGIHDEQFIVAADNSKALTELKNLPISDVDPEIVLRRPEVRLISDITQVGLSSAPSMTNCILGMIVQRGLCDGPTPLLGTVGINVVGNGPPSGDGTFVGTINWGDGTTTNISTPLNTGILFFTNTYAAGGTFTVTISGNVLCSDDQVPTAMSRSFILPLAGGAVCRANTNRVVGSVTEFGIETQASSDMSRFWFFAWRKMECSHFNVNAAGVRLSRALLNTRVEGVSIWRSENCVTQETDDTDNMFGNQFAAGWRHNSRANRRWYSSGEMKTTFTAGGRDVTVAHTHCN